MFKLSIFVIVVSVILYYIGSYFHITDSPIVTTENGLLMGRQATSRGGKTFYEYRGIPYAKPPIGDLRYESPQKFEQKWEGVRFAQSFGAECPQAALMGDRPQLDENCLFLNVHTPIVKVGDGQPGLPVMVFFHGGAFIIGTGNIYGANYLIDEEIILVTINYRLGPLGFLNSGDGLIRGNMGLKDQVMALQWVQNNIENFGGDKNRVTIIGQSAGGISVEFLIVSPLSKGLFHRAISQSGSALGLFIQKAPEVGFRRYAKRLHCDKSSDPETVACLKRRSISDIVDLMNETQDIFTTGLPFFGPSLEVNETDSFLSTHPYDLVQSGRSQDIPWLSGYNSHEGLMFVAVLMRKFPSVEHLSKHFENKFHQILFWYSLGNSTHKTDLLQNLRHFYFGGTKRTGLEIAETYGRIFTDGLFAYGISESMKIHAKSPARRSPIYPYYYSYRAKFQLANLFLAIHEKYPVIIEAIIYLVKSWISENILGGKPILNGAGHADELGLLFTMGGSAFGINSGHEDYLMSKKLVKLWASFAKGEKDLSMDGVPLPRLDKRDIVANYLHIMYKRKVIPEPNLDRLNFWEKNSLIMTANSKGI